MPAVMPCRVTGMDAFRRSVLSLAADVQQAVATELAREMVGVLEVSQELCPVDTKRLVESGAVSDPSVQGDGSVSIRISYGGDNEVPYALIQHERLDYRHAAGKQAKFLERPLLEWTRNGPGRAVSRAGALVRARRRGR